MNILNELTNLDMETINAGLIYMDDIKLAAQITEGNLEDMMNVLVNLFADKNEQLSFILFMIIKANKKEIL